MRASELRIGNFIEMLVLDEYLIRQVEAREFYAINLHPDWIKPIPLTEEWLLKFGVKRSPANNSIYLSVPELKAEIHFEMFRKQLVCVLYCSTGSFIPNDIKYVHQLQNLYFALTGEELTFNN